MADAPLYVERWLLDLKAAAAGTGLEAHVRALDVKGGERLSFELRAGDELVEMRYHKRRTGARPLAAATGAAIAARALELHRRQLEEHRGLLENGRRRLLRRSILLLESLQAALSRDVSFPALARQALAATPDGAAARPAAVARIGGRLRKRVEVLPAAALSQGALTRLAGILDGRLVDLSELLPRKKDREEQSRLGVGDVLDGIDAVVNLSGLGIELVRSAARRAVETASGVLQSSPEAAGLAAEAAESTVAGAAPDIAEAMAEAGGAAVDAAGAATEGAAATAEVATHAGSCLADAACVGFDCGAIDCIPG